MPETQDRPAAPEWMKVRLKMATPGDAVSERAAVVRKAVGSNRLVTVCEEASCPNLGHCWSQGTATLMIMGDRCTRRCKFCDIRTAKPLPLDADEPKRVLEAVIAMKLDHVVITSVDRDDLDDLGSTHFAAVISILRSNLPNLSVEVLIPDFKARPDDLARIWKADPHIINHNVETVPSLYKEICPQSNYGNSLATLRLSGEAGFVTKSGIILGLGEEIDEVRSVMRDLRDNGVQMLTIGQYLQPSPEHAPVKSFPPLAVFKALKEEGLAMGFRHVESGPLVRSSYHAGESAKTGIFGEKSG